MKTKTIIGILLIAMGVLSSCSSFNEVHYFKDKVGSKPGEVTKVSNYYRVKICGYSFLSSSRYVSGYFNQDAINLYFNEFTQPENGALGQTRTTDNVKSLVTNEDGNELVLVFSTNAKAISSQIGNIAKNQVILNSAAQLTQKDKLMEAAKLKYQIKDIKQDIDFFSLSVDSHLSDINSKTAADLRREIQDLLNSLN
ncbi:hypothetical protein [Flavobacterium terrisoli]|uniref:hypothetical protein n=1 Tax=Flavobacterium terrisoli TaxID=3242195 RepID=UPI0025437FAD|nr:hypothetical protein [Flavobacterium buctense]